MDTVNKLRNMTDEEARTHSRLLQTVRTKQSRNKLRSSYREAKKALDKVGFSIPPHMRDFQAVLGWPDKACKVPARRVRPDGFTLGKPSTALELVQERMADPYTAAVEDMAIDSALEHSVSFVFVTPGDTNAGEPEVIITARTALEATAELDPRTNQTRSALEMVSRNRHILYLPGRAMQIELDGGGWVVTADYAGIAGRVPVTPYVWGRSLKRPFGHSRITRPLMSFTDSGVRTMLRQEVNAEFYGAPQRALMGAEEEHFTDEKGNRISPLDALIGGVWALPYTRDDETGDLLKPTLQQLSQASMQPHGEMLKGIAMQVSSETGIPVGYLGVQHDNPSSADAIRAAEYDLISLVESELPSIGASRADVARNVAATINGSWTPALERELAGLQSHFQDPGTPTQGARADAGLKYAQTFPEGDPEVAMELYGLTKLQINRNLAYMKKTGAATSARDLIAAARARTAPAPAASAEPAPAADAAQPPTE